MSYEKLIGLAVEGVKAKGTLTVNDVSGKYISVTSVEGKFYSVEKPAGLKSVDVGTTLTVNEEGIIESFKEVVKKSKSTKRSSGSLRSLDSKSI